MSEISPEDFEAPDGVEEDEAPNNTTPPDNVDTQDPEADQ